MRIGRLIGSLLFCWAAYANTLAVRIDASPVQCLEGAEVRLTPEGGGEPRVVQVAAGSPIAQIPLPQRSPAVVEARRAGCWGDRRSWAPGDVGELALPMFQAATVTGEFTGAAAARVREVHAQVYLRSADPLPQPSLDNSECTVAQARWACTVPANVAFDLRLDVPGFASSYFWDLALDDPSRDLGSADLVPGASIAGWIADPATKPLANARVTLYPMASRHVRPEQSAATLRTVRSGRRGFFHFSGLPAGGYRLVSEAPGMAAAVVSEVTPRAGEAVTLPMPVRHSRAGELSVTLVPPVDRKGQEWTVQLTEGAPLYPGRQPAVVMKRATPQGRWSAAGLRPAAYTLRVFDRAGAVVRRAEVEVLDGGPSELQVAIPQIVVRGALRAADAPLRAEIDFSTEAGQHATASSDDDGRFEAVLPAPGSWKTTVKYQAGKSTGRVVADPIHVPDDLAEGAAHEVTIDLPGGRVHGVVTARDGRKGPAVVHAWRGNVIAAQQRTDEVGGFDFIGLKPGTYRLDAQSAHGSTPEPLAVDVGEHESREITLWTEPYRRLHGRIATPDGRWASGAVIQLSHDGVWWERLVADARGFFERDLPRSVKSVQLIVLTYDFPARILAAPLTDEPLQITLPRHGGTLRFRTSAVIFGRGVTAPVNVFKFESTAPFSGQIRLEAGIYTLCPTSVPDDRCRRLDVPPASDQEWDFSRKDDARGRT